MAVELSITSDPGGLYNGKMTWFVVLSCMMAAMGGVIFGYDIGISGGVTSMEPFLEKFFPKVYRKMKEDTEISNYCKFDSQLLTSFTSSMYVAGGAAFLAGAALGGSAFNVYMLILGRVLLGVGVGFANQAVPLYLSEMAPPRYRGAINNGFQFSIGIGALSANLINYGTEKIKGGWGWRISLAMAAVPATILTIGAIFLPETPSSLIQLSDDTERAKLMLQRVRGTENVQAELDDLIKASSISKTVEHPFKNIMKRKYRPQLDNRTRRKRIPHVLRCDWDCGYWIDVYINAFSRQISAEEHCFIFGGVQMFLSQIMVGGIMASQLGDHGGIGKGYSYVVLILICVYVAGFSWSWGPLGWLVPSEIFPLEIRSAGQSIVVAVSFLFTFIVAQTFLAMLCHFKSGIFFFFGGWVVVMTAFVYYLLPETKNTPIEKMDRVWREIGFWNKFVGEMDETD
ncbi:hypothetical protein OIU77_017355 [Salix suchowensis]|uniref:Major facilitator superfamily (MFS) profile domain-containing protein n=1 Tax=Salix suchowensis TaxID=1278906 RepID=A0ABQ8ZP39_9ROSI|nr:hypothetical protein OIU77_017355 [Salix suchowensis]